MYIYNFLNFTAKKDRSKKPKIADTTPLIQVNFYTFWVIGIFKILVFYLIKVDAFTYLAIG
jgi:hypothetical protein